MSEKPVIGKPFQKGVSGNPHGRPSIAKAMETNGTTTTTVLADLVKRAIEWLDDPNPRRAEYAHTWLTNYTVGKPKDQVDLNVTGISEAQIAHVAALALTPHERRKRIEALKAEAAAEEDEPDETGDDLDDADD